jgi:hypothetical protein
VGFLPGKLFPAQVKNAHYRLSKFKPSVLSKIFGKYFMRENLHNPIRILLFCAGKSFPAY